MRANFFLGAILAAACLVGVGACGSSAPTSTFDGGMGGDAASEGGGAGKHDGGIHLGGADGGSTGKDSSTSAGVTITSAHIVPADATLIVKAGATGSLTYKVMGVMDGTGPEVDVTDRFVFYVPQGYLVGDFPTDGSPTLTTLLNPKNTPPQLGGELTIQAQAENPGDKLMTITTGLTVELQAQLPDPSGATTPANPQNLFGGPVDTTRAPALAYPNNGTMLPPNLQQLEVHWTPGPANNTTLYRVEFQSAVADIAYYVRCGTVSNGPLVSGACALQLDATGYGYLALSNAGNGPVTLAVSGTDDTGTSYGTSSTFTLQFAENPVVGGVYYWDVTNTQIMDFEFGSVGVAPQIWIAPTDYGTSSGVPSGDANCIGCHTLSPDGTKLAASMGGQWDGFIVYQNNMGSTPTPMYTDPTWLTLGTNASVDTTNHMQFATFDPAGDEFVSVYDETSTMSGTPPTPDSNKLWFHDGTTGLITGSIALDFVPDHPNWSPDGTMLAMTQVGVNNTSQREYLGGITVAEWTATNTLGTPTVVVPSMVAGQNSFNPNFVPDSSYLIYSVATCPTSDDQTDDCDSDVANNLDEVVGGVTYTTTTWAVQPKSGATPIHLANAAAEGVADTLPTIDTFPRSTPFKTVQGTGELFWFTVASQRAPGLRSKPGGQTQQLLWMCAMDPAQIMAGKDGSYTCFFLPFQDFTTSNHIAEWTQQIVSSSPPPTPPPPPPPPPPPAPPPPPK
jgi:hypothetical protein